MSKSKESTTKQLTVSQQKELEEWQEKVKSGEAYKIVENELMNNVNCDYFYRSGLEEFTKNIFPKWRIAREKFTKEEQEELVKLSLCRGLDNGLSMMGAVEVEYRGLMQMLRKKLIEEFDCKTYSEKALVDMIIGAYARNLSYSKEFLIQKNGEYFSKERNHFLSVMSKEIDRANRHFLTALEALRQIKQPELKINVRAKTAFIAQNQNLINNQNNPNEKAIEAK